MIENPNVLVRNLVEKEGVVFNGTIANGESQREFLYEGSFQYLDLKFIKSANGGSIIIRDSSDNYSSNNPTGNIKIYNKDTGEELGTIITVDNLAPLNIRIDARLVDGIKVFLIPGSAGLSGKLSVTKINGNMEDRDVGIKFVDIIKLPTTVANTSLITHEKNTHKAYGVLKLTMNTAYSQFKITIFDGTNVNTDAGNKPQVFYKNGTLVNNVSANFVGTRYYVADFTNLSRINYFIPSGMVSSIDGFSVYYTDDINLANRIAAIPEDMKLMDIVTNQTYEQYTFLPKLSKKRWYVLYLDFISGTIGKNTTAGLSFISSPIVRFDGVITSTLQGFNFVSANEFKSGYYLIDLKNVDINSVAENARAVITSTNISDLKLRVLHIGQFDDISQFMQVKDKILNIGDDRFFLKYLGHRIDYALDDYWVEYNGDIITLCKNDILYTINLSDIGWRLHTFVQRQSLRLLHPTIDKVQGSPLPNSKTMLMIAVEDSSQASDNHAFEWWVCDVTNPYDALTKSNWSKCKFWEKRGTKRKIPTKNSGAVDANHRYDTTLPDSFYNYDEVSSNGYHIAYQGEAEIFTLAGFGCHGKKMTLFGQYTGTNDRVCLWATTDGGFNFVCVYDFVGLTPNADDSINTSAFSNYSSGLTLSKITRNIPTEANKEPEHKYTITELSGWSITKGTETVINFSSAHGLDSNEIIVFTGDAGAEWNQLRTNELTADSIGDNAYMYIVNSATQITLKPYRGSYDDILKCRHIHSVNETKSGFVFATGEAYPQGWTMFLEQKVIDAGAYVDAMTDNFNIYRLNSSENSLQRGCGVIMIENEADPTIIFNSDDGLVTTNVQWSIEGRTNLPMSSSSGIWKGKLSDIDDYSKFKCIADIPEPAIWMFRYNGIIVGYYQLGGIAVSIDDGKSFRYYPYYDGLRLLVGVYKGKIVMNQGYALELK